jgi:hypothetical protein
MLARKKMASACASSIFKDKIKRARRLFQQTDLYFGDIYFVKITLLHIF